MIVRLIAGLPLVFKYGYLAFLLLSIQSIAQQPGGVSGTKAWYVSSSDNTFLIDKSGHGYDPIKSNKSEIFFNFNPAALFTRPYPLEFKNFGFNQGTVVGIFYPQRSNQQLFELNYDTLNLKVSSNSISRKTKSTSYTYNYGNRDWGTTLDVKALTTGMKTATFHSAIARNYSSAWGEKKTTNLTGKLYGYLPEFILYNRVLSPLEVWKVHSYLAIKYGITLDTSYITREGSVIWDVNDVRIKKFHNRVSAIVKDSAAALIQPKSNTSYEEGYVSYKQSSTFSVGDLTRKSFITIPPNDSPSLYRSLTIQFSDLQSVPENTYLVWGDDGSTIPDRHLPYVDKASKIQFVNRIWLLRNPSKINTLLRFVLAGHSYDSSKTVFEKIYAPFDYQFYRYLLIKLTSPDIKDTAAFLLNSYFGREQSPKANDENFNTRFLVWDSVLLNKNADLNYFTFGRVPLLSFWEVHYSKGSKKLNKVHLKYMYDRERPLTTETNFDTTLTDFKDSSIVLKLSLGVNPVIVKYKEDKPGRLWKNVSDTISQESIEQNIAPSESIPSAQSNDSTKGEESEEEKRDDSDIRYITKRPWKEGLPFEYLKIKKLKTDVTYIFEATDRLGQRSTLRLTLKSTSR